MPTDHEPHRLPSDLDIPPDDPVGEMKEVLDAMRAAGRSDPALESALLGAAVAHERFLAKIYGTPRRAP